MKTFRSNVLAGTWGFVAILTGVMTGALFWVGYTYKTAKNPALLAIVSVVFILLGATLFLTKRVIQVDPLDKIIFIRYSFFGLKRLKTLGFSEIKAIIIVHTIMNSNDWEVRLVSDSLTAELILEDYCKHGDRAISDAKELRDMIGAPIEIRSPTPIHL